MKIASMTGDFAFFCRSDEERIRELYRAGFRYIDLSLYALKPDSVYLNDGWETEVLKIKELADGLGMKFVQAHSQGGNFLADDPAVADFVLKSTLRSIEICGMLGIKNTVLHAGLKKGVSKEEWQELNKAFYSKLFPTMEKHGVNVLCENSASYMTGSRYYINTGAAMREFIEYVDHPLFHGCWDTGHANCEGSQYDEITALGEHLYAIHYNDNHGKTDDHKAPFTGILNHDEVINALIDVNFKGYFTLECDSTLIKYNQWTGERRRYEREDRLREPQLFMQRHVDAMMYDTAKWMLGEYGLFEE